MNMSYCRFTNTLGDLRDCYEHMEEMFAGPFDPTRSQEEYKASRALVKLCVRIACDYGHEVDQEVEVVR